MTVAQITLTTPSDPTTLTHYTLDSDVTTVGRATTNMIVVRDHQVSRQQARIVRGDAGYRVENMSDHCALFVNDRPVDQSRLSDGDRLGIGASTLTFELADEPLVKDALQPDCITIDARDRNVVLSGVSDDDLASLKKARTRLASLYEAGQALSSSLSSEALYRKALGLVVAHMPTVDCCSLHMLDRDSQELVCRAARFRSPEPEGMPRAFSRTILNQVLAERKAVLTFDARDDDRFEAAQSIASLDMRAAMCVPLQIQARLTGVIQAHTLRPGVGFDVDDLKLLTAFGMMVGAAIENAVLYEQLESERAAQADRARVMQVMLHELKSPISGVRMLADTLRLGMVTPEKLPHVHGRIVDRLDGMLEWIRDTLHLSKLKSGQMLGQAGRIDLMTVTCAVTEEHRPMAEEKGLAYDVVLPTEAIEAIMPETAYRLIISNLMSNAVKYTTSGSVKLVLDTQDDDIVLSVTDTGIGIPTADIPGMFGEFFRARNARSARIEGSGVGLASVKLLVDRLGGELSLDSVEGRGSTFVVRLPRHTH